MNMIYKLIMELKPEHILVVTDSPSSWRKQEYVEYKSQRSKMPEDMKMQLPILRDLLALMNIPFYEVAGYEADDVIASLSQLITKDYEVLISSNDKDLCQLVGDNVYLYDPQKMKKIASPEVIEKFGVRPDQIIDYLCLVGDKVDNIPGIPGIGEKTATKLLLEHENLDSLLANLDKVKQKDKFLANIELLKITKKLVTLNKDLKLQTILSPVDYKNPAFFLKLQEIELPSVIKKFKEI